MSDMLIAGIICNKCGNTLPPHTEEEHFDINNDIHKCPHNKKDVIILYRMMDKYPRKDYVEKKTKKQRAIDAVNKLYSI